MIAYFLEFESDAQICMKNQLLKLFMFRIYSY